MAGELSPIRTWPELLEHGDTLSSDRDPSGGRADQAATTRRAVPAKAFPCRRRPDASVLLRRVDAAARSSGVGPSRWSRRGSCDIGWS